MPITLEVHTLAVPAAYKAEAQAALDHNAAYCQAKGYIYTIHDALPQVAGDAGTRPVNWYKIPLVQEALRRGVWVLWLDADCLILDQSRNLADLIDPAYDLIFSPRLDVLNSGVFFASPNPWTIDFCDQWWADPEWAAPNRKIHDQRRLVSLYRQNAAQCQAHLKLVDRGDFQDGRLIRHLSGSYDPQSPGKLAAAIAAALGAAS